MQLFIVMGCRWGSVNLWFNKTDIMRYLILFILFPAVAFTQKPLDIVNDQIWQANRSGGTSGLA